MANRMFVFTPFLIVLFCVAFAQAQEIVRKEAPPEIKIMVGDIVAAVNGSSSDFEAFAQKYFAPELLKKQSTAERAALHSSLAAKFGKIGINGIRREGMDAPLLMMVKGDKSEGELVVEIDESNMPPKILGFSPGA